MAGEQELFELSEGIELAVRDCYEALLERFPGGGPLSEVFRKLAAEESQHALRIRMIADQHRRRPGDFGALGLDREELRAQRETALILLERYRDRARELLPTDALEQMAGLENSMRHLHAEALAVSTAPELARFFEQLAGQDEEHMRLLRKVHREIRETKPELAVQQPRVRG